MLESNLLGLTAQNDQRTNGLCMDFSRAQPTGMTWKGAHS